MSAVKRLMESLEDMERLRDSLIRQGASVGEIRSLSEQVDTLWRALNPNPS